MTIYLDHNATCPPAPEVVEAVASAMRDGFGNAASPHVLGRASAMRVGEARDEVAALIGVAPSRVVWTSGATEALNTAMAAATHDAPHLLVAPTEHKAVLDVAEHLAASAVTVTWLDVDPAGRVTTESVNAAAPDVPFVLTVMAANNETGVLNDVETLTALVKDRGGLVVCDATQQAGKTPLDLDRWGVDYACVSAHKMYGPVGVGALVVPAGVRARPTVRGGGHQRGWRSGTLNVPGIVGFGVAARLAAADMAVEADRLEFLRDRLLGLLEEDLGPLDVNGSDAPRLPNTLNVRIPGVPADALIVNCPDVAFSSGSACTSAVPTPSHVLTAMGLLDEHAEESVRLSLGRGNGPKDIADAARILAGAAVRVRGIGVEV